MRIREWQDIVEDVVESNADPDDWRAISGARANGVGEDMYLGHPRDGVYQLKTYAKNPFEVKGYGTRIARKIDEDIEPYFPTQSEGRFAVQTPPEDEGEAEEKARNLEETIKAHADAPTTPDALFDDMMEALDSPAYGPIEHDQTDRPEPLDDLSNTFEEAEELLETEFEDLVEDDGVGRGFQ
ncbi:MAG: hypothetical protein SVG88_12920 [Halobacteriales archaeon]|nr:hypothetical protein [Halobacteriales archaeon]